MKTLAVRVLSALLGFAIGICVARYSTVRIYITKVEDITEVSEFDGGSLMFEGTVLDIGEDVPPSGECAFYRFAKYRVERVTLGHYSGRDIVVNHLSLSSDELDSIKIGDRVCVSVSVSKEILSTRYEKRFREPSERVETFYIGGEVNPNDSFCRQ